MKKCEEWLEKNHPAMHEKLYSEGGLPLLLRLLCSAGLCWCLADGPVTGVPRPS